MPVPLAVYRGVTSLLSGWGVRPDDEGFAINRFEPAERGSDWFSQDSLNILGHGRFAFGLTGDWAHQPLVMYGTDGDEVAFIPPVSGG